MMPEDAFINDDLLERVNYIDKKSIMSGEWEDQRNTGVNEKRHTSELDRLADAFEKRDFITVCRQAVRQYPHMYLQVLAEYMDEIKKNQRGVK